MSEPAERQVASPVRLLRLLSAHVPADPAEARDLALMRETALGPGDPFSRDRPGAHFTASAILVDPAGARVCMVHHAALGRWLQPGGHLEPEDEGDVEAAALREAREETGCRALLHPAAPRPLDVDAHPIPARGDRPGHLHLDVRFLAVAEDAEAAVHDPRESLGIAWLTWEEAMRRAGDRALRRALRKARAVCEEEG